MSMICAIIAFVFIVVEIMRSGATDLFATDYVFVKLFLEATSGISFFIATEIFSENSKVKWSVRLGLYVLVFCILGLHYYSVTPRMFEDDVIFISRYIIFIACFHLLVSFVAYYKKDEELSFWRYNISLLSYFFTALLYSTTVVVGISGVIFLMYKMQIIEVHLSLYYYLFFGVYLILNTLIFLFLIPSSLQVFSIQISYKRSIRIFAQYFLLPIWILYCIILYYYTLQIFLHRFMPNGWVCIPIILFSILGIFTYLILYPIRNDEKHPSIKIFNRYFFYLLLPVIALFFISIALRMKHYGITEDRYLVFILGVWILGICLYFITYSSPKIVVIPISLFSILFMSAIGPWGMFQLSSQNQVMRLERLLKRNQLLVNGKLAKLSYEAVLDSADVASIQSILEYLSKRGQLLKLRTWLNEEDRVLFEKALLNDELNNVNAIFSKLPQPLRHPNTQYTFFPKSDILLSNTLNINKYNLLFAFTEPDIQNSKNNFSIISNDSLFVINYKDTLWKQDIRSLKNRLYHIALMEDSSRINQVPLSEKINLIQNKFYFDFSLENDSLQIKNDSSIIYISNIVLVKKDSISYIQKLEGIALIQNKK